MIKSYLSTQYATPQSCMESLTKLANKVADAGCTIINISQDSIFIHNQYRYYGVIFYFVPKSSNFSLR